MCAAGPLSGDDDQALATCQRAALDPRSKPFQQIKYDCMQFYALMCAAGPLSGDDDQALAVSRRKAVLAAGVARDRRRFMPKEEVRNKYLTCHLIFYSQVNTVCIVA